MGLSFLLPSFASGCAARGLGLGAYTRIHIPRLATTNPLPLCLPCHGFQHPFSHSLPKVTTALPLTASSATWLLVPAWPIPGHTRCVCLCCIWCCSCVCVCVSEGVGQGEGCCWQVLLLPTECVCRQPVFTPLGTIWRPLTCTCPNCLVVVAPPPS